MTEDIFNKQVDYINNTVGTNPYPFNSRKKQPLTEVTDKVKHLPKGQRYCNLYKVTDQSDIDKWNDKGYYYNNGISIIPDLLRRGKNEGKNLVIIDFDYDEKMKDNGQKPLLPLFLTELGYKDLEDLSKDFYVEHHKEENNCHVVFIVPIQFEDFTSSGLEVYANGNKNIIIAPSRHADGNDYTVMGEGKIPLFTFDKSHDVAIALSKISNDKYIPSIIKYYKFIKNVWIKHYREGSRHELTKGFAGLCRKYTNITVDQCKQIVKVYCNITGDAENIEDRLRVVEDTYSMNKDDENIAGWSVLENYITNKGDLELIKEYVGVKEESKKKQEQTSKDKEESESVSKYDQVIQDLYEVNNFVYVKETEQLLYYDKGVYRANAEILIRDFIENKYPNKYSRHDKNEIFQYIKDQNIESITDFIDYTQPALTNLENGFYDMKTMKFEKHETENNEFIIMGSGDNIISRPKHKRLSVIQHPIIFDPHAKCHMYGKWFKTVCSNDSKKMQTLYALMGNNFYRSYDYPYALFLVGRANAGKGTFFRFNTNFVGLDNCGSVPFEELINDKYADSELVGKCLNIDTELKKAISVKDFAKVKRIISNEENKRTAGKFQKGRESPIYCKVWGSGNYFPPLSDNDDEAVAKRIVPIGFDNQFLGKDDDKDMLNKLLEEKSGVFNVCRYAWYYFLYKGNDNLPITLLERMDLIQKYSKQLYTYLEERYSFYVKSSTEREDLTKDYRFSIDEEFELRYWFVAVDTFIADFKQWRIDNKVSSVNFLSDGEIKETVKQIIKDRVEYFDRNRWKSDSHKIVIRHQFKTGDKKKKEVFLGLKKKNDPEWENELKIRDISLFVDMV